MQTRMLRLWVALIVFAVPSVANAQDLTILVPSNDDAVRSSAEKLADGKTVLYEKKLFKAFDAAANHLTTCKTCTVTIKVAGGAHTAKGNTGLWSFPETIAPEATLRILGSWDAAFKKRAPFTNPSILVTAESRTAPVIQFEGKKHALKELHLSGFTIDVAPGNKYDGETNSLLKGSSATWVMLAFGYITVERLIIADNVFMNGAHGVASPLVRPAGATSEVIVRNNLFLNVVFCWQVKSASGKHTLQRYLVEGNSFIFNWPYNPDTTTSNPGTLEIGNKSTAALIEIKGNLFAYNFGGAIFPQWDDKAGPKIAIKDNLFWNNGQLFEPKTPGEGAVIGKFNRAGVYAALDPDTVEEDFSWDTKGNVVLDPKLAIPTLKLKALGQKKPEAPAKKEEPAGDLDELDSLFDDKSEIEIDTDVNPEDYADDGKIKNYAPRWPFNLETLPFPQEAKAKKYGADASRVVTP